MPVRGAALILILAVMGAAVYARDDIEKWIETRTKNKDPNKNKED